VDCHKILKTILRHHIKDHEIVRLLEQITDSFHTSGNPGVGLPLGNLSSQLLVNVYMNKFDQYVKRILKIRYYIRYADDFVFLHEDRNYLIRLIPIIAAFLKTELRLSLHPKKVFIKTIASGVDFLGWVHFPHHRVLRTTTKRRILKRAEQNRSKEAIASYLGILTHGDAYELSQRVKASQNQRI
jgi:RNA-directed DNA polymerase